MNNEFNSNVFKEEAYELLEDMEQSLIDIESSKDKKELLNNIFRALHTIKGSGSMYGFNEIAAFTHEFESLFDSLRKDKISINNQIISLSLKAKDHIKNLLNNEKYDSDSEIKNNLLNELRKLSDYEIVEDKVPDQIQEYNTDASPIEIFKIIFKPTKEIFQRGLTILPIFNELRLLGDTRITAFIDDIPDFETINSEYCYMNWIIVIATNKGEEAIKNVFIFAEYYSEVKINKIASDIENQGFKYKKIGEILIENELINENEAKLIKDEQKLFGEIALEKGLLDKSGVESALNEQNFVKDIISEQKEKNEYSTIRVKNEKLDDLLNLAGEFVTIQARLKEECLKHNNYDFCLISENLNRLTDELRDISMQLRMVPFSIMFNNFKRLAHDLSGELNKKIKFEATGGDTEVDKNIIDLLKDPIMHIIRNCADHGIEDADTRVKNNKPSFGIIQLHAEQSGPNILITVKDDGAGLPLQSIKKIAIEHNIIDPDENDEKKILNSIFLPGFSTAKEITGISGRGVGLDIVKKNIEKLKGSIDIESHPGIGTKAIINIPLTLAIIEGLLVAIDDSFFIINLSNVKECIDLDKNSIKNENTGNIIKIREEIIPYIRLKELFGNDFNRSENETMVITEYSSKKTGIIVDKVIGKCQGVIKPMSKILKKFDFIFGASILGDGTVALILDIRKIIETDIIKE